MKYFFEKQRRHVWLHSLLFRNPSKMHLFPVLKATLIKWFRFNRPLSENFINVRNVGLCEVVHNWSCCKIETFFQLCGRNEDCIIILDLNSVLLECCFLLFSENFLLYLLVWIFCFLFLCEFWYVFPRNHSFHADKIKLIFFRNEKCKQINKN